MLLAFVAVVAGVYLDGNGISGGITSIIGKVNQIFNYDSNKPINLLAGKIVSFHVSTYQSNGKAYPQSESSKKWAYQTAITDKDGYAFPLEANSLYEFTIDPSIFVSEQNYYSFTLAMFANNGSGNTMVFDSNGINVGQKDNKQWNIEALVNKVDNIHNMEKYGFSVDRQYNDNNTITYTIQTGNTPLSVGGNVFANSSSPHYHDIDKPKVEEFANTVTLTKIK